MNCVGLFGRLFGHKFVIEVVREKADLTGFASLKNASLEFMEALQPVHSTRMYCKRCGHGEKQ